VRVKGEGQDGGFPWHPFLSLCIATCRHLGHDRVDTTSKPLMELSLVELETCIKSPRGRVWFAHCNHPDPGRSPNKPAWCQLTGQSSATPTLAMLTSENVDHQHAHPVCQRLLSAVGTAQHQLC